MHNMQTHVSKRMLPIHGLRLEWMKEELCREIYTKPIAEHWNICGSLLKYLDWDHSIPDQLFKMVSPTPTQTLKNCSELCLVSRQHWAQLCCVARRQKGYCRDSYHFTMHTMSWIFTQFTPKSLDNHNWFWEDKFTAFYWPELWQQYWRT